MQPTSTAETSGRIGLVVADAFAREDFRESLQLIADGVRDIAGFDVAAISELRDTDEFEFIAVSGDDDARNTLLGRFTPRHDVMADLARAESWGRFRFLPAGTGWRTELTWIPDVDYPDVADAWHPENLLSAPLCDEHGALIGMLGVDVPQDGLVPDPARRGALELYAAQAERVLARALRQRRQSEQLRLADAARDLVRRAASSTDVEELIATCEPVLLDAFRARGLLIQVFEEDPADSTKSIVGAITEVPEDLGSIAVDVAHLCWAAQRVGIVSVRRATADFLTERQAEVVRSFLELIGRSSILLAPLGAGPECLGVVAFTRSPGDEEWSQVESDAALDLGQDLGRVVATARTVARDRELVARLRELDRYKGDLIATITHELKTPLTTITGHLELLEDNPHLDEGARTSLAALQRGSTRLTALVEDLLLLSRVSDAAATRTVGPVDLRTLVAEAADLVWLDADRRTITLMTHLAPDAIVEGDASELALLVTNLVSNAVKYTPDGGRVDVTLTAAPGRVCLVVRDTGIGISATDQEHLFEEFFRSPDPEARSRPGTGLGLAIVARVTERAGGTIEVASTPGRGSTFTVVLPTVD
ncbi:MAG: sensor histidine kinase [Marmoricola sp.]